jgi:hypothetical protein
LGYGEVEPQHEMHIATFDFGSAPLDYSIKNEHLEKVYANYELMHKKE